MSFRLLCSSYDVKQRCSLDALQLVPAVEHVTSLTRELHHTRGSKLFMSPCVNFMFLHSFLSYRILYPEHMAIL